jgi:hypothetical protein
MLLGAFSRKSGSRDRKQRKARVASVSKLNYTKPRTVSYNGQSYEIGKPSRATQSGKKYQVVVRNKSTGQKKTVAFGAKGYTDYLVHRDSKRRKNFQKRFAGIKLKDGTRAKDNPFSPAYHATRSNW